MVTGNFHLELFVRENTPVVLDSNFLVGIRLLNFLGFGIGTGIEQQALL